MGRFPYLSFEKIALRQIESQTKLRNNSNLGNTILISWQRGSTSIILFYFYDKNCMSGGSGISALYRMVLEQYEV